MRHIHRDVEFVVNSSDGVEWAWDAYPKKEFVTGTPLHGKTKGSEADAVKACKTAIDEAFGGQTSN